MAGPFVVQIERGADAGTRFTLGSTATIGRQAGLEITLNDPQVSRQHARLDVLETRVLLTDLGGANGIFVNRQRVNGSTSLLPGDGIEIGGTLLRLMGVTAPQPKTAIATPAPVPGATAATAGAAAPGMPAVAAPQPVPGAAAPAVAAPRSRTPLIVGGVAIALVLLCICVATILAAVGR